jgi:hypothetical protein
MHAHYRGPARALNSFALLPPDRPSARYKPESELFDASEDTTTGAPAELAAHLSISEVERLLHIRLQPVALREEVVDDVCL